MPKPEQLRALSIRQPWAERILLGEKTVEYRSQPTKVRGKVYIYASLAKPDAGDPSSGRELPRGLIVGTVEIVRCDGSDGDFEWHLSNPERLAEPLAPQDQPQPVWFYPFGRPVHSAASEADTAMDSGQSENAQPQRGSRRSLRLIGRYRSPHTTLNISRMNLRNESVRIRQTNSLSH